MDNVLTLYAVLLVVTGVQLVSGQFCAPKLFETYRWTLQITQADHGSDIVESVSHLSFDVIGQRLVSQETGTLNGHPYSVYHLYYYPAGALYTVHNGVCTVSPLSGNITDRCFSWSRKVHVVDFLIKEFIGVYSDGSPIMGGIYYQDGIGSLYTFDVEGAIPLFEGRSGIIDGTPTYTVSSYLNVTLGISDPSVFTPPDNCIKDQLPADVAIPKHHSVILDL